MKINDSHRKTIENHLKTQCLCSMMYDCFGSGLACLLVKSTHVVSIFFVASPLACLLVKSTHVHRGLTTLDHVDLYGYERAALVSP